MAKRNAPASQQPEEAKMTTGHPLMAAMTQTDAFAKAARERAAAKEFQIGELETWKQTVIALAASPNGQLFLKSMVQHSGMLDITDDLNTMNMVQVRFKSAFYRKWVRPFLTPDQRSAIE